ncbi:MAG: hypothetical protein ACRERU_11565 [Methylococcales bacterium]
MSIFSNLFGNKKPFQQNASSSVQKPCDWLLQQFSKGIQANEVADHISACPVCRTAFSRDAKEKGGSLAEMGINVDDVPSMMMIGVSGKFDLNEIIVKVVQDEKELVVMGDRSPAFTSFNTLMREAIKFRHDPALTILMEQRPDAENPLSLDPLIIVRRKFFLETTHSLQAKYLGELAIQLLVAATNRNLGVDMI